jgi:hypothetical protein
MVDLCLVETEFWILPEAARVGLTDINKQPFAFVISEPALLPV